MKNNSIFRLLLATSNRGKAIEIRESLAGLPIRIHSLDELGKAIEQPHETGKTFAENAVQKSEYYFKHSLLPSLADDSGIIVEALQNELGIHTRRWGAGPQARDREWIDHFLKRMKKEKNKRARFVCVLALTDAGSTKTFEGVCEGTITEQLEAEYLPGLPLSACFRPDGYDQVFSGLNIEQKNNTSHRGRALNVLRNHLLNGE